MLGPDISTISPKLDVIGLLTLTWQWLIMIALTFWVGMLVIEHAVVNRDEQISTLLAGSRKQVQTLQWLCLSVLFISEIIAFILRTALMSQSLNDSGFDPATLGQALFQSSYGYIWIARMILILASMALLWWVQNRQGITRKQAHSSFRRFSEHMMQANNVVKTQLYTSENENLPSSTLSSSFQPLAILWFILAGFILITYAISGGTAQLSTPLHFYALILEWFLLAAQCIWLGGFAYLCYILLPSLMMIKSNRRAGILITLLLRLQPLMLVAMCVFFVSELLLTIMNLRNTQQFITEPYGRVLLVNWVLIFILFLMSAYDLFVLRPKMMIQVTFLQTTNAEILPRHGRQVTSDQTIGRLRQALRVQSWLGATVLLCTTLLTFFAPPIAVDGQQAKTSTPSSLLTTQTKQVDHISVTLSVIPGKINAANTVTVMMKDTRSGDFITNAHLIISTNMQQMDMGTTRVIMAGGNPMYTAKFAQYTTFSMTGIWDITLSIQLPQQIQETLLFQVWLSNS